MSPYLPSPEDRWAADQSDLRRRVATLEQLIAQGAGAYGAFPCTSSTRPASPRLGQEIYETDTTRFLIWSGSAWEQKAFARFVCTSSTRPASPFTGLEIWETDTGRVLVYDGSAWQSVIRSSQIINTLAAATGSVNFTTTTEADLTGATVTITTTHANAVCVVVGVFDMQVITAGSGVGLGMLTVDGTDQSGEAIYAMTTSGARDTVSQVWQPTLASAGSHTLKLRGNLSASAGSLTFNSSHTRISVTCYDL